MLRCVIVDDSQNMLLLLSKFVDKTSFLKLVGIFSSPTEAFEFLQNEKVDLLLLDIEMPEMTGIELLKSLTNPPATILITSKKEFALEAFELDVKDYIVKPPDYHRFLKATAKINTILSMSPNYENVEDNGIYVKVDQKMIKVMPSDIIYIEALSDYILIHNMNGRQYMIYSSLKSFLQKLQEAKLSDFVRVHRSYIVNLKHIISFTSESIEMDKKQIPIGNTYKEIFLRHVSKF